MYQEQTRKKATFGKEVLALLVGSLFYAIGFRAFIEPAELILGGATGAATLLHGLLGLPIGIGVLLVNLPLFLWNTLRHGIGATLRTGIGILASSVSLDLFASLLPITVSKVWGAVLGGILSALGIAVLLSRDFTTGGSELAAVLLRERFSLLTVGKTVLLLDTAIVLLSVFLLGKTESLFYSVLLNLTFAVVLDLVYGDKKKNFRKDNIAE